MSPETAIRAKTEGLRQPDLRRPIGPATAQFDEHFDDSLKQDPRSGAELT